MPGALAVEAVIRTNQLYAHEIARDYAISPSADPGMYLLSMGEPDGSGKFNYLRFGRVALVGGQWTYTWSDIALGDFAHQGYCNPNIEPLPGGRYWTGGNCLTEQEDANHSNPYIWSCVTRPNQNGVRKIWAVHSVRPLGESCARVLQWYEIDTATGGLTTWRYGLPDGDWAHDPSIAVNGAGVKVITFNRSYADTTKYPGVWRLTIPPVGPMMLTEEKAGPGLVHHSPSLTAMSHLSGPTSPAPSPTP